MILKIKSSHRDILNILILDKGELLHALVENKGDAIVEERLPKHLQRSQITKIV